MVEQRDSIRTGDWGILMSWSEEARGLFCGIQRKCGQYGGEAKPGVL